MLKETDYDTILQKAREKVVEDSLERLEKYVNEKSAAQIAFDLKELKSFMYLYLHLTAGIREFYESQKKDSTEV